MMTEQDISYALAKQAPDIGHRGCTIGTAYGDITIPAGRVADAVARAVTRALQCELLAATKRAEHDKRQQAAQIAPPPDDDGLDYFDRQVLLAKRQEAGHVL